MLSSQFCVPSREVISTSLKVLGVARPGNEPWSHTRNADSLTTTARRRRCGPSGEPTLVSHSQCGLSNHYRTEKEVLSRRKYINQYIYMLGKSYIAPNKLLFCDWSHADIKSLHRFHIIKAFHKRRNVLPHLQQTIIEILVSTWEITHEKQFLFCHNNFNCIQPMHLSGIHFINIFV